MPSTSQSLLDRLRSHPDPQAWQRLVTVYEPWLRGWLVRHRLQPPDVDDLLQSIFLVVSQKLPLFVHNGRPGAFRAWLRAILVHQVRYFLRTQRHRQARLAEPLPDWLDQLEDPGSGLSRQWDEEHDREVVRRLLAAVRPEFEERTWEVFRRLVLDDQPAVAVARQLGMQRNAVYVAKARVLARLRRELHGLMET